jgi:hypothetical protein
MSLAKKYGNPALVAKNNKAVKTLQEGGQMAAPAPEAGPQGGGGGEEQLMQMIAAYRQQPSPELAVQIADTLVMMVPDQGGAPAGPEGQVGMAHNGGSLPGKRIFRTNGSPQNPAKPHSLWTEVSTHESHKIRGITPLLSSGCHCLFHL